MNISTLCTRMFGCRWCLVVSGALALSACTTFSQDGGFETVARATQEQLGKEVRWTRTPEEKVKTERQTAQLLQQPLSVDDAVQIALLNNGSLQASFEELGISEADVVQSGRLPNPRFTLRHAERAAAVRHRGDGERERARAVDDSLRSRDRKAALCRGRRRRVRPISCKLAARTREAYFTALAARETAHYLLQGRGSGRGRRGARAPHACGRQLESRSMRRASAASTWRPPLELGAGAAGRERCARGLGRKCSAWRVGTEAPAGRTAARSAATSIEELPEIERTALDNRIDLQGDARAHRCARASVASQPSHALRQRARRGADARPAGTELASPTRRATR